MVVKSHKEISYPKSVYFIISNEFCERFSHYGMRTILTIYFTDFLLFSQANAKIIYHVFIMLVYFFPILGAMLADSLLGKYRTILYVSIIYAMGNVILALAASPPIHLPSIEFSMLGLLLIAVGTGGIKPCVAAFGGDQFVLPQQEKQLTLFFSFFYFAINLGSFISTFVTPILRDQSCFGDEQCFTLAFGVPGILMIISIIVFALGKRMYKIINPEGNMFLQVSKCIWYSIKQKFNASSPARREHWLDYGADKYGAQLIEDIKGTLRVLVLYIPLPVFWALFDQQGSGWTFLARRMNGDIGFYTILPDQMQVVNPILILLFIPMFEYGVYPILEKLNVLRTPLKRMTSGGILAALAFGISAIIAACVEAENPIQPQQGNGQFIIYNNYECDINFNYNTNHSGEIHKMNYLIINANQSLNYHINGDCIEKNGSIQLEEGKTVGYLLKNDYQFIDSTMKDENGFPLVRNLVYSRISNVSNLNEILYENNDFTLKTSSKDMTNHALHKPGIYSIKLNANLLQTYDFKLGGVYSVLIDLDRSSATILEITKPNTIHILWLLPQYIVITAAEIMFSITGLEFSYSQAPISMKSVVQACWLLTTAFGNLLVIIIESSKVFDKLSLDFTLYTGLMLIDMLIFSLMAMKYKYLKRRVDENVPMSFKEKTTL